MDPTRLPGYLGGATDMELAQLAQQARNPAILAAVQAEMTKRDGGGLRGDELTAEPDGWVPPWQRQDKPAPYLLSEVAEGPVSADTPTAGPAFEGGGRGMASTMPNAGTSFGAQPVARAVTRPPAMDDLPEEDVGFAPGMAAAEADPIDVGAAAARESTAARKDQDLDVPQGTVELARTLAEAGDDPDAMAKLIAEIQSGVQSPEDARSMAIARAGFAMAGSRNPYFFGALGEGATAGLDAYEKSRQEALMNRVRVAALQQDSDKFKEQKRATGVGEKDAAARLTLAERNVAVAENEYKQKVAQYNDGKASDAELKAAEVRLRNAQAKYYSEKPAAGSSSGSVLTQIGTDSDGNPIMGWTSTGKRTESENTASNRASIIGLGIDSVQGVNWQNVSPAKIAAVGVGEKLLGEDIGNVVSANALNEDEARLVAGQAAIQEGITAAITGAAYTERQANNYQKAFVPQASDSPERRVEKLQRAAVLMTQLDLAARQQHVTMDDLKPQQIRSVIEGVMGDTTSQPEPGKEPPAPASAPPATPDNLPVVKSPEEARKLPPGTLFLTPDGKRKQVPNE